MGRGLPLNFRCNTNAQDSILVSRTHKRIGSCGCRKSRSTSCRLRDRSIRSIVDGAYRVRSKSKFRAVRNRGVEVLRYGQAIKASKVFWDVPDIASRVGNPLCVLSALESFSSGVQLGRVARLLTYERLVQLLWERNKGIPSKNRAVYR